MTFRISKYETATPSGILWNIGNAVFTVIPVQKLYYGTIWYNWENYIAKISLSSIVPKQLISWIVWTVETILVEFGYAVKRSLFIYKIELKNRGWKPRKQVFFFHYHSCTMPKHLPLLVHSIPPTPPPQGEQASSPSSQPYNTLEGHIDDGIVELGHINLHNVNYFHADYPLLYWR